LLVVLPAASSDCLDHLVREGAVEVLLQALEGHYYERKLSILRPPKFQKY